MSYFKNIKECRSWLKKAFENHWYLISTADYSIYISYDDLPTQLNGSFVLARRSRCYLLEIIEDLISYTEVDYYKDTGIVHELYSNRMSIMCGDYRRPLERHEGYAYVDLGLPSRLKWAARDLCKYGPSHYAWGEVKTKPTYTPKNALKRTKYTDIKADPKMDTARVKWEGKWRMPTIEEFEELLTLCDWEKRGYGYTVTGPNGNSIFFFAQSWPGEVSGSDVEDNQYYWTCISKEGEDRAACLKVGKDKRGVVWENSYKGFLIRPVFSDEDVEQKESFKNDPNAPEFSKGIVEKDGRLTEKFVYIGEQSHKGGNRATAKGYIKTGDVVDITFLGASEKPLTLGEWNPVWEMDDSVSVMGEDYFFEVLVNGKKSYIGKYGTYRYTEKSKMGGGVRYEVKRTRIDQETVLESFNSFKKWLLEGAKKHEDWHFLEKKSDVNFPIPNGLPYYPEPEDTTPDAPIGYKCVLLEKPGYKGDQVVYGKQFYYDTKKLQVASNKVAREVLASCRIGGGEYLDWEDDAGFGNAPSFADYIDCKGLRYAVVPLYEEMKEGVDKNGVVVSEQLYKSLLSSHPIEWIDIK